MKLASYFGIATFAVAISVAAVGAKPTQAALVNYGFTVDAISGSIKSSGRDFINRE